MARGFGVASVLLVALYPLLPPPAQLVDLAVVYVGSAACVALGRRAVGPAARLPWTLLLIAQLVLIAAHLAQSAADPQVVTGGWLLGAVGNGLAAAAALSLVLRRGVRDLGGLVDAGVFGLAVGTVLWAVLPHNTGGWAAELHRFVVVFALPATLGPLVRLLRGSIRQPMALWWLFAALALAIAGHILNASAGTAAVNDISAMLFMLSLTAVGLFALDPSGLVATRTPATLPPERLSTGRLVLLGLAVTSVPVIGAGQDSLGVSWPLLVTQGLLITALVMVRIGLLATSRERAERALTHRATHDPLTELPNRYQLVGRLRTLLAAGEPCALLFCDLDDFKPINDQYGHDAGDRVLEEVAQRLRLCVRAPDFVSRIGGDEFVVLLVNASQTQADIVRDRVEAELARPADLDGVDGIRASIGVAAARGTADPEQLLAAADRAMYEVKKTRRPAR